jgi:fatty-acyl-CoA synthase
MTPPTQADPSRTPEHRARLYPRAYHRPGLLDWLEDPRAGYGIHFADEQGGWNFWDYPKLASAVARAADAIVEHRDGHGGVVTVVTRTGPEFIAAFFGSLLAGNTPSPLAFPLTMRDPRQYVQHATAILEVAQPTLVLADESLREMLAEAATEAGLRHAPHVLAVSGEAATPTFHERAELALLQFTSGSSGRPRGVRVTWENIESNIAMIRHWLRWTDDEPLATWLPLYHDMGLIGGVLTPLVNQTDIWIMRPDQFIRDPLLWLECFGSRQVAVGVAPNFGFAYATKRIPDEALEGMDFSPWKAAIVAAERLDPQALGKFAQKLAPHGFRASAIRPAYGLAEATLAVTGLPLNKVPGTLRIDWDEARMGQPILVEDETTLAEPDRVGAGDGWLVACGEPHPGVTLTIADEDGNALPERCLGEIVVEGSTVAHGYEGRPGATTRFDGRRLHTGDAGFFADGDLFVLGRLGDSIKVRGRTVFVEDVEARLTNLDEVHKGKCVVLAGVHEGRNHLVALVEATAGGWMDGARAILQSEGGSEVSVAVVAAERGTIERTSSGKPRRRVLWQAFVRGAFSEPARDDDAAAAIR